MNKKSTIKIKANVLKGIMEFREKSKNQPSKWALGNIGFSMDGSKSKLVRYHVSDGAIGITGTVGEVKGDRLPKAGVALRPSIYIKGLRIVDELTLKIDHEGLVDVSDGDPRNEIRLGFNPGDLHAPVMGAVPKCFGGKYKASQKKVGSLLLSCELYERVMRGLKIILKPEYTSAIRVTFFDKHEPIVFTPSTSTSTSNCNWVAVQMLIADGGPVDW